MKKVSVIIPTCNRPDLLKEAVASVDRQTYRDFEIIVIDDGKERLGGGAARNKGIRQATGEYIAFLDDDDVWLPEKLKRQMDVFASTPPDVGFCMCAVTNVYDDHEETTTVPDGVDDYFELALEHFNAFLNVTLLIKKQVLDEVGYFDESLPSHQETDLVLRMARKYKGLGVSEPLVRVNVKGTRERIGTSLARRIAGREIIINKYFKDFQERPALLATHYFRLGLLYRDDRQYRKARDVFYKALKTHFSFRYALHYANAIRLLLFAR